MIETYKEPWWARIPHLSTLIPHAFSFGRHLPLRRERLIASDGGVLLCDWLDGHTNNGILIIVPGLESHSKTPGIQAILRAEKKRGGSAVVLHARGCGGEANVTKVSYHSNFTSDISTLIKHIQSTQPNTAIKLLGLSLGGNQVANYLAQYPDSETQCIHTAVLISPPLYLAHSANCLDQALNGFYATRLLKTMREKVSKHVVRFPELKPLAENAINARTIRQFDAAWTAPIHGFDSVDHYYDSSSAHHNLSAIKIPTTCLIAHDDPISPPCSEVIKAAKHNPALNMVITQHGGHLGFPHRNHKNWLAEWIVSI